MYTCLPNNLHQTDSAGCVVTVFSDLTLFNISWKFIKEIKPWLTQICRLSESMAFKIKIFVFDCLSVLKGKPFATSNITLAASKYINPAKRGWLGSSLPNF